jgi:hypothetical protein
MVDVVVILSEGLKDDFEERPQEVMMMMMVMMATTRMYDIP